MILRKPYAFLIKNFKLIHWILLALMIVIGYKYVASINFFQGYIKSGYTISVSSLLTSEYIPFYLIGAFIIVIAGIVGILVLLIHKNKACKFYIFMGIYYFILLILFLYLLKIYNSFSSSLVEASTARAIRDVLVIAYFPQFFFACVTFIRAIGFNLKKFDFVSDMIELDLISSDNEEFELNVPFDNETTLRKIRRYFREIKYYFFENKFIILIILGAAAVGLVIYGLSHKKENYNKNYSTGQTFIYNQLQVKVIDSIISNIDYAGNKLDQYYLVARFEITNNTGNFRNNDFNSFKLVDGKRVIDPSSDVMKYFKDYSSYGYDTSLSNNSTSKIALAYPIGKANGSFKIRAYTGSIRSKDKNYVSNIFINLHPKLIKDDIESTRFLFGDKVEFSDSYLNKSSIKVNSCSIKPSYLYTYSVCNANKCDKLNGLIAPSSSRNSLLICDIEYYLDESSWYRRKDINDFLTDFSYVVSIAEDSETVKAKNITPETAADFVAYEISKSYEQVSELQLVVNIRNYKYQIYLMSS